MSDTFDKETCASLVNYRKELAFSTLDDAKFLFNANRLNASANRLYYACFYIVEALLIKNCIKAGTHQGAKAMFSAHFIATQKLDKQWGKYFSDVLNLRKTADYDFFINYDKEDIEPLLQKADTFINLVKDLI